MKSLRLGAFYGGLALLLLAIVPDVLHAQTPDSQLRRYGAHREDSLWPVPRELSYTQIGYEPVPNTSEVALGDSSTTTNESSKCVCPPTVHAMHANSPSNVFNVFYGYDAWRGYPDGAWTNNGIHVGLNQGTRLGRLSQLTGIGIQIGGSVGVYDWGGTDYRVSNQDKSTTQGFVTCGFFRRADENSNVSSGFVQDWMINNNYSVMGEDSTLYQWRAQLGYTLNDWNEVGVWGAWRGRGDTRTVGFFGPVTWQPHNQLSFFWHHKWGVGQADTWIWFGVPERDRLTGGGTLGDYVVGVASACPISDRLSLYNMVNYMHQSASPGPDAAKEEAWNFYVGIAFYPRGLARSRTVRGHKWAPLLPVANNGLFLVDASRTY